MLGGFGSDDYTVDTVYGYSPEAVPPRGSANPIPSIERAVPRLKDAKAWDPENPLFWLLAVVGGTLGLIAFNASFRVGPVRTSAALGKKG